MPECTLKLTWSMKTITAQDILNYLEHHNIEGDIIEEA